MLPGFSHELMMRRAVSAASGVTWNAADRGSANLVLSNGNLTVTSNLTAYNAIRSTSPIAASQKVYFEILIGKQSGDFFIGIANSTASLTTYGYSTAGVSGILADGTYSSNAVELGSATGFTTGQRVSVAIDRANGRIWFRTNGGTWNASGTVNPTTNVGGFAINGTMTTPFAYAQPRTSTDNCTVNFGASAFTYAIPSGFVAYNSGI